MSPGFCRSAAASLCLLVACTGGASSSRAAATEDEAASRPTGTSPAASRAQRGWRQAGIASWYGAEHHGKRTASGARFDMHALTAAHRTLPFGTMLRVENTANGRSIVVRVNDRGPVRQSRIIDLSMEAARRLGIEAQGTGRVTLEAVAAR